MIIGLPKALLYYQYGTLLETFLTELGCEVLISDDTNKFIFEQGMQDAVSECCIPAKAYLGHVRSLKGRCDYLLVPYATRKTGGDAICLRFWGISDVIRHTYPDMRLLEYDMCKDSSDFHGLKPLAKQLGKNTRRIRFAYEAAADAQKRYESKLKEAQKSLLQTSLIIDNKLKILVAGHPYIIHDPAIGGPVVRILSELGATPIFSDRFDRKESQGLYRDVSPRLFWAANQEVMGAIATHKKEVDGILLLTVFPCAPDALACEMIIRTIKDIPIIPILLDGLHGEAGLVTRLECFLDIINERKCHSETGTTCNFIPTHGQLSHTY